MPERRVWICQCLCPSRHAILAAAGEADSEDEARRTVRQQLRRLVVTMLRSGALGGECSLCGAKRATWKYELGRTLFATMDEAAPRLKEIEAANLAANALYGEIHKTQRPN